MVSNFVIRIILSLHLMSITVVLLAGYRLILVLMIYNLYTRLHLRPSIYNRLCQQTIPVKIFVGALLRVRTWKLQISLMPILEAQILPGLT